MSTAELYTYAPDIPADGSIDQFDLTSEFMKTKIKNDLKIISSRLSEMLGHMADYKSKLSSENDPENESKSKDRMLDTFETRSDQACFTDAAKNILEDAEAGTFPDGHTMMKMLQGEFDKKNMKRVVNNADRARLSEELRLLKNFRSDDEISLLKQLQSTLVAPIVSNVNTAAA